MSKGKTAVVIGAQWGDEGKGKIVDVLSENFRVVARYAGGHNAGHTVTISGKKFVLQLIPCGVLRPGCRGVIGNGVVLDPIAFLSEVQRLRDAGVQIDGNLFVSNRAHVILPYHRMVELASENAPGRVKSSNGWCSLHPRHPNRAVERHMPRVRTSGQRSRSCPSSPAPGCPRPAHPAVPVAVAEVDGEADDHPDQEPQPGLDGQVEHQVEADQRRQDRQVGAERHLERAVQVGAGTAEDRHRDARPAGTPSASRC